MGLFSGKTTISVSSVAYNIAGDADERANFLKQSLIYLNASNQSIGEKLPRMYLRSLGVKLKSAYKYAASLPQGLPTSSMQLWEYQDFEDAVQTLLDIEHGPNRFKVEDAYFTKGNTAPVIEKYLNRKYGWDSVTGQMANPPAGMGEDTSLTWKQDLVQDQPYDASPSVSRTYEIEFREDSDNVLPDSTETVSLEAANTFSEQILVVMVSEWVVSTRSDTTVTRPFEAGDANGVTVSPAVSYAGSRITVATTTVTTTTDGTTTTIRTQIVDDSTSEAVSKEYVLGTGEWPSLDALWISRSNVEQTFYPSIPLRLDNKDVLKDEYSETDNYKQIVKQCSMMGMDVISIRDQVNANPSIKDIDYVFIVAGANMNTESQAEMDYLYRFWDLCRERSTATQSNLNSWLAQSVSSRDKPKTNSLVIQDPESKNGAYKITIEWDYVTKTIVEGEASPGLKVGHYVITDGATATYDFGTTNTRSLVDSTLVNICKQISATQYERISISGAVHKNDVYEGKTVETLAKDARKEPTKHEGFIVPLHMGIFNTMSIVKRTQLAQECVYLIFNTYVKTKQKWYQTSAFKWILAIILIIVTVVSLGTATPITSAAWGTYAVAGLLGIGATATLAIMLVSLALNTLYAYLVSYLLGKWQAGIASVFGERWASVVTAIVTIVVSFYAGGGKFDSSSWLKTAVQIIDAASQLFTGYAKGTMAVRQKEYDAFVDQVDEDKKVLDKLSSEFFGDGDLVSIDYLLELQKTLREDSPTVFMTRTLLTGSDIVDITLGQVSEMADMTLAPRLQGIYI